MFSEKPSIISVVVKGVSCPLEWDCLSSSCSTNKDFKGFWKSLLSSITLEVSEVLQCICRLQIKYSSLPSSEFHQNHKHLSILPVYLSLKCSLVGFLNHFPRRFLSSLFRKQNYKTSKSSQLCMRLSIHVKPKLKLKEFQNMLHFYKINI